MVAGREGQCIFIVLMHEFSPSIGKVATDPIIHSFVTRLAIVISSSIRAS